MTAMLATNRLERHLWSACRHLCTVQICSGIWYGPLKIGLLCVGGPGKPSLTRFARQPYTPLHNSFRRFYVETYASLVCPCDTHLVSPRNACFRATANAHASEQQHQPAADRRQSGQ